jgi:hypothetical protein
MGGDGCPGAQNDCVSGTCEGIVCGAVGQDCCPVPDGGEGDGCPAFGAICVQGSCAACGTAGQPCCPDAGDGCFGELTCSGNNTCG